MMIQHNELNKQIGICVAKYDFCTKVPHWAIVSYDILIPWLLRSWPKNNFVKLNSSQWTSWKWPKMVWNFDLVPQL